MQNGTTQRCFVVSKASALQHTYYLKQMRNGIFPPFCCKQTESLRHTPKVAIVERSQLEIEQFLAMLRFENCSELEELPDVLK